MMTTQSFRRLICRAAVVGFCAAGLSFPTAVHAQAKPKPATAAKPGAKPPAADNKPLKIGRGDLMDYGPFLSYSVERPREPKAAAGAAKPAENEPKEGEAKESDDNVETKNPSSFVSELVAIKGISVHVGNGSTVCFDTDTMSLAGGWTGAFLDIHKTNIDNSKGDLPAMAPAPLQFTTNSGPGWAMGDSFSDTRPQDGGPLPPEWAHYRGLFRDGQKVVFSYTVGKTEVLELDGSVTAGNRVGFTRTIRVGTSAETHRINICDHKGATGSLVPVTSLAAASTGNSGPAATSAATIALNGNDTLVTVLGAPAGATLEVVGGTRIQLNLPALAAPAIFKVVIGTLPHADRAAFTVMTKAAATVEDPETLCHGGAPLWNKPIVSSGARSTDAKAAYVLDTLRIPDDNPWKSWMRLSGIDFFSDGRAAVCTWNGDVWIISGLDDTLAHVTWRRYAAGMYEPLGLRIVDDVVYVLGRDQITRLHDLNNDGEADYYENFCSAWPASPVYHAFSLDLQSDSKGNFYYANCGNWAETWMRMKGVVLKIPKEGGTAEVFCKGLRAPNGMGMGPNDEISVSDNQGHWTPVDRIDVVKPGGFYGYVGDPRREKGGNKFTVPDHYDPPLCWIPYPKPDNSAGSQVWAGKNWGPLSGEMLCLSYGQSDVMAVFQEEVDGVMQGGVMKLPPKFASGAMRARVNPKDGQVWVCGLKGWQTNATSEGCLQRIRYTGKKGNMPVALHVLPTGLSITFSDPLDPKLAVDDQSYGVSEWVYHWTSTYGSHEYKASAPQTEGHDEIPVKSVKMSADHKTVTLETGPLKPVMQMKIEMHLKGADGSDIEWEIDNTINKVPGQAG